MRYSSQNKRALCTLHYIFKNILVYKNSYFTVWVFVPTRFLYVND